MNLSLPSGPLRAAIAPAATPVTGGRANWTASLLSVPLRRHFKGAK